MSVIKYKELYNTAMEIQINKSLNLYKDEQDYAFTFVYPPVQCLEKINMKNFEDIRIESANIYIHIPYCTGKCNYCYFCCYKIGKAPIKKNVYIELLDDV